MIKLFHLSVMLAVISRIAVLKHVGHRAEAQDSRTRFHGPHKDVKEMHSAPRFFRKLCTGG